MQMPKITRNTLKAAPYRSQVMYALHLEGVSFALSAHDEALVERGVHYGVGPCDCAYQIIDDRATIAGIS
jgi:hypothetical protein